jgi:nucleoside-diphosphate-sugar epimerase
MRILITGANGRFARSIVEALSPEHTFRALDMQFSEPFPQEVERYEADLRDPGAVTTAVQGTDAVLHLAPISVSEDSDDLMALDMATRGTYVLMNAARESGVAHVIVGSTLDLFERMPANWRVNEVWRPRPMPNTAQLCAWLAELSARECARVGGPLVTCLRFGHIVDDAEAATHPFRSQWLHVEDAVKGVSCALRWGAEQTDCPLHKRWRVHHITAAGPRAKVRLSPPASAEDGFGYRPAHDFHQYWPQQELPREERSWEEVLAPAAMRSRAIRKVAVFGAGGPVGAVTAVELSSSYSLRLLDVRPVADIIAEGKPQMPGAPLPTLLGAPHEYGIVDVRDPRQVMAACEGVDAIINLTVIRYDPIDAFRVNTLGAINIMRAAVVHSIRRVVQTGPLVEGTPGPGDYSWDYDVHVDAPARPYNQLYIHSKYLGQEASRVFAEYHGLELPVLLFAGFVNPELPGNPQAVFAVSWQDSARAIRRALELGALPAPFEMFNVTTDLPQGRFRNEKTRQVLGWVPRDRLEHYWRYSEP